MKAKYHSFRINTATGVVTRYKSAEDAALDNDPEAGTHVENHKDFARAMRDVPTDRIIAIRNFLYAPEDHINEVKSHAEAVTLAWQAIMDWEATEEQFAEFLRAVSDVLEQPVERSEIEAADEFSEGKDNLSDLKGMARGL